MTSSVTVTGSVTAGLWGHTGPDILEHRAEVVDLLVFSLDLLPEKVAAGVRIWMFKFVWVLASAKVQSDF